MPVRPLAVYVKILVLLSLIPNLGTRRVAEVVNVSASRVALKLSELESFGFVEHNGNTWALSTSGVSVVEGLRQGGRLPELKLAGTSRRLRASCEGVVASLQGQPLSMPELKKAMRCSGKRIEDVVAVLVAFGRVKGMRVGGGLRFVIADN